MPPYQLATRLQPAVILHRARVHKEPFHQFYRLLLVTQHHVRVYLERDAWVCVVDVEAYCHAIFASRRVVAN